ncbi:hypothetical protein ACLB2K_006891 [Fragaria x ananassa]
MTQTWKPETSSSDKKPAVTTTGMRLIVPLQGLYLKRHRPSRLDQEPPSPSLSSSNLAELHQSASCSSLSGRGSISRVWVSSQADPVAKPNESTDVGTRQQSLRPTPSVSTMDLKMFCVLQKLWCSTPIHFRVWGEAGFRI